MTEAVVDQLEVVEVHRDNADRAAVALTQLHGMVQSFAEQRAVGQPGQRVAQRLIGDGDQQPPVLADRQKLAGQHGEHQQARDDLYGPRLKQRGRFGGRDDAGQQQRRVRQPDRGPTRHFGHLGVCLGALPAGGSRDRDQQQPRRPADVDHVAAGVLVLGRQVGEQAVRERDTGQSDGEQGELQTVLDAGPNQQHRGQRQDDHVGDRVGQRDHEPESIGATCGVERTEDRHPADEEQ